MPYGVNSAPRIGYVSDFEGMDHVMCLQVDTLNVSMFRMKLVEYLGHRVDAEGINPTSEKLKAISDVETPGDVKQLRSYPYMYRATSNTSTGGGDAYVEK